MKPKSWYEFQNAGEGENKMSETDLTREPFPLPTLKGTHSITLVVKEKSSLDIYVDDQLIQTCEGNLKLITLRSDNTANMQILTDPKIKPMKFFSNTKAIDKTYLIHMPLKNLLNALDKSEETSS